MRVLKKIKDAKNLTAYRLAQLINELGVSLTTSGMASYLSSARISSMRIDVICAIRKLSGLTWEEFGSELDREYLLSVRDGNKVKK